MCLKSSTQTQQYPLRSRVNAVMSQNIFCRCTDTMLARWFLVPSLIIKHAQHVPKYCKNSKSVSMSCCSGRHSSINHFLTPSINCLSKFESGSLDKSQMIRRATLWDGHISFSLSQGWDTETGNHTLSQSTYGQFRSTRMFLACGRKPE